VDTVDTRVTPDAAQQSNPGGPQHSQVGVITQGTFTSLPFRLPVDTVRYDEIAW
jgi:hypothetical protein